MRKSLFFVSLILLLPFSACKDGVELSVEEDVVRYFCDASDPVSMDYGMGFKANDSTYFKGAEGHCVSCGLNNSDGVQLDSVNVYGMNLMLLNLHPGEYFEVSVYEKEAQGFGAVVAKFKGGANYALSSDVKNIREEQGWKKHFLSFTILTQIDTAEFFVHSGGKTSVFDDFEILRYPERPATEVDLSKGLNLFISDSSQSIIDQNLNICSKLDVIPEESKGYVNAGIIDGRDTQAVEMRLKGDWTDHIKSGNPSFRIKTNDAYAFDELRSFSIQHPRTRNFMHEWFFHQLLEMEDVLTTRYNFLPVSINGKYQGVYALEEHFDKQILESRSRREGPILKIDEAGFWTLLYNGKKSGFEAAYPYYEAAKIGTFKENRTLKNPVLKEQYINGITLLEKFKNSHESPEELFDLKKEAKFYALMEIGNVVHGLAWHNRRFYLNPVTQKLEQIGYDLQPGILPMNETRLGNDLNMADGFYPSEKLLNRPFFKNDEFRNYYLSYLNYYTSVAYLDSVFSVLETEIAENESLIQLDLPGYYFNVNFYYERAEYVKEELKRYNDTLITAFKSNQNGVKHIGSDFYKVLKEPFYLEEIALNFYLDELDSLRFKLAIENFHLGDVELIGYSTKSFDDSILVFGNTPILLKAFPTVEEADAVMLDLRYKPKKVFFRISNSPGSTFSKEVGKSPLKKSIHPRIELNEHFQKNNVLYTIEEGNKLVFKKGDLICEELLYIPSKYDVHIQAGTRIDFINGGGLITNSSTYILGSPEEKVRIVSSDSSARGIAILNAETTEIKNLVLSNMNTLNKDGWVLTGGLTVYESNVSISNMEIYNAQSEDALNLVRCQFNITNLIIEGTYSDAFDADFCEGSLNNSSFANTGNDCIDFSGSVVNVDQLKVRNSGDKAVSAGERSTLMVTNVDIEGAETAFAAKDKSVLTVKSGTVKKVKVGAAAFQKKPEFGPGQIEIIEITYENVGLLALIEKNSSCIYLGNTFRGYNKFDIEKLYAKFNK